MEATKRPNLKLALLSTVLLDIAAPLAIFSVAKAAGLGILPAASIGLVVPAAVLVYRLITRHRPDQLDLFSVVVLIAILASTLVAGDPRLVLAKDGVTTAVAGIAALVTLLGRRPLYFTVARPFGEDPGEDWDQHWAERPRFVHLMRTVTAVWGMTLLADAVVRIAIAFALPTTIVPAVGAVQYTALVGGLVLFTVRYTKRNGSAAPVLS